MGVFLFLGANANVIYDLRREKDYRNPNLSCANDFATSRLHKGLARSAKKRSAARLAIFLMPGDFGMGAIEMEDRWKG